MPNANDLRKTLTDPTPLYFAAGVLDKIREEAPERIKAVRETDPKEVQERFSKQAKEAQAKVTETLSGLDSDLKKLREQAQHLALQGVGVAAEYAVKAREVYDEYAVRGRGAVESRRDGRQPEQEAPHITVEREPVKVAEPPSEDEEAEAGSGAASGQAAGSGASRTSASGSRTGSATSARSTSTAGTKAKTTAKTTAARTSTAKSAAKNGTGKQAGGAADGKGKSAPASDS